MQNLLDLIKESKTVTIRFNKDILKSSATFGMLMSSLNEYNLEIEHIEMNGNYIILTLKQAEKKE